MKKVTSLLLALVMALALAVPAFAADTWPTEDDKKKDVTAKYEQESLTSTGNVYYVTIKWEATAEKTPLSYTGKQATYTWNGETMQYSENTATTKQAAWAGAAGYKVTVTNQSNAIVYATPATTNEFNLALTAPEEKAYEVAAATVTKTGEIINPSDVDKQGKEQPKEFNFKYAEKADAVKPTGESRELVVGRITVTVSKTNA